MNFNTKLIAKFATLNGFRVVSVDSDRIVLDVSTIHYDNITYYECKSVSNWWYLLEDLQAHRACQAGDKYLKVFNQS